MKKVGKTGIYYIGFFTVVSFALYLCLQYPKAVFATGVPPHSGPTTYTATVPGTCVDNPGVISGSGDGAYMVGACSCSGGGDGGGA